MVGGLFLISRKILGKELFEDTVKGGWGVKIGKSFINDFLFKNSKKCQKNCFCF